MAPSPPAPPLSGMCPRCPQPDFTRFRGPEMTIERISNIFQNGFPVGAQRHKMQSNRSTKHTNKAFEIPHIEMAKQGRTQNIQSLIYKSCATQHRSFNFLALLRMFSKWHPTPFEIEACGRFGTKKLVGERLQKDTKTKHQKSTNI